MATTIKITIYIQKTLFDQADHLAQQLTMSRSDLFGLAIETFIKNHQNQILLDEINQAYPDKLDFNETSRLSKMRKPYRNLVQSEW